MSLKVTKSHLIHLLSDPENKVIALSGKWGTGKSHLWKEVQKESVDDKINGSLYVSLFGLSTMDQVKVKIVQSALPKAGEYSAFWDTTGKGLVAASKALSGFFKGTSAIGDFALLAVPIILKKRVIVLDDIERKHANLSVDEVMGFIDEFTQQHSARFILILNSDQLLDKKVWDVLREKVIDQEVRLDTDPVEAFEIARGLAPSPYADRIKRIVEVCGITNIRTICKVMRAVNRVLGGREDLSDDVLSRVVPSTVLLAATHYKGIENGPDFDFILKIGNSDDWGDYGKKAEELDDAAKLRAKWRITLLELGINSCDEYENLVVEFLKSGLFDTEEVSKIIDRYVSEADAMRTKAMVRQLHEHAIWHYKLTDAELLAEASELVMRAHQLDAFNVTSLHGLISDIPGSTPVADSMVDHWIAAFQQKSVDGFAFDNFFNQPLHPKIRAAIDEAKANAHATATVFDACSHIAKYGGWGHKQEAVMKASSIKDFEETIKSLKVDDLRFFMCRFLEMCVQSATYKQHFGTATDNFIQACRNIHVDPQAGRLSKLIEQLFKDAKLEAVLVPPGEGK